MPLKFPKRVIRGDGCVGDDVRGHIGSGGRCVGAWFTSELVFENIVFLDIFELTRRFQVFHDTFCREHRARLNGDHIRIVWAFEFRIDGEEILHRVARGSGWREPSGAATILADLYDHLPLARQGHFAAHSILRQCVQHYGIGIALRCNGITTDNRTTRKLARCDFFLNRCRFQGTGIEGPGARRWRWFFRGGLFQLPGCLVNFLQSFFSCFWVELHLGHDACRLNRQAA